MKKLFLFLFLATTSVSQAQTIRAFYPKSSSIMDSIEKAYLKNVFLHTTVSFCSIDREENGILTKYVEVLFNDYRVYYSALLVSEFYTEETDTLRCFSVEITDIYGRNLRFVRSSEVELVLLEPEERDLTELRELQTVLDALIQNTDLYLPMDECIPILGNDKTLRKQGQ